jgi:predicted kinase
MKDMENLSQVSDDIDVSVNKLIDGMAKKELMALLEKRGWNTMNAGFIATAAKTKINQYDWVNGDDTQVMGTQELLDSREVTLTLLRGLPGSGKTSFAEKISDYVISADDYFMVDGQYQFDSSKLGEAHADCLQRTRHAIEDCDLGSVIVVENTFSQHWEMAPYLYMTGFPHINIVNTVIDLFDSGLNDNQLFERNTHGVPLKMIKDMRKRWEYDWKSGKMTPSWEE